MSISVIIGLGNPGRQYEETRHNVGFMILDRLAAASDARFQSAPKWQSQTARLPDGALLVKPQTFMNLSGRSVRQILGFLKIPAEEILVVFDDAALPLGTLRFREKGSSGGHNGIQSIIEHLGTQDFLRLKVGIGGGTPGAMVGHVLGKFAPEERPLLENTLATAVEAVHVARSEGVATAANRYHNRQQSTASPTDEPQIPRPDRP